MRMARPLNNAPWGGEVGGGGGLKTARHLSSTRGSSCWGACNVGQASLALLRTSDNFTFHGKKLRPPDLHSNLNFNLSVSKLCDPCLAHQAGPFMRGAHQYILVFVRWRGGEVAPPCTRDCPGAPQPAPPGRWEAVQAREEVQYREEV